MNNLKILFVCVFCFSSFAFGEEFWVINKDHSEVQFKASYMSISEINGRFSDIQGEALIDNQSIQSISIKIGFNSIYTGNNIRDAHLKSPDFVDTKKFPSILFTSNHLISISEKEIPLKGLMEINGIKKEITIIVKSSKIESDTWNFKNRFVWFKGEINRRDFNINWDKSIKDSKYLVGESVRIFGQIQLQPKNSKTPTHKFMIPDTKFTREKDKLNRGEISKTSFEIEKEDESSEKNKSMAKEVSNVVVEKNEIASLNVHQSKSLSWWASLLTLGMMAFSFAIYASYSLKMYAEKKYGEKYVEEKHLGIITDLLALAIITLFAICFWVIGWGQ